MDEQKKVGNGLVTVIMPAYRMGAFIGEALASVGAQTYTNWEVIVVDDQIWTRTASELHKYVPQVCIQSYLKRHPTGPLTVITMRDLGNAADMARSSSKIIPFSSDVGAGVYGGYTVTYENLQLAVHLGLNPIYLIGCDHFYAGSLGQEGRSPVTMDGAQNHFVPGYAASGEVMNPALISKMTKSYEWAHYYAQQHGVEIINASRGGFLNVFPRAELDTILASSDIGPLDK